MNSGDNNLFVQRTDLDWKLEVFDQAPVISAFEPKPQPDRHRGDLTSALSLEDLANRLYDLEKGLTALSGRIDALEAKPSKSRTATTRRKAKEAENPEPAEEP